MSQLLQPPLYRYSVIQPVTGMASHYPHLQVLSSVTYVVWLVTGCGDSDVGTLRTTNRLAQVCDGTLILWPLQHHAAQLTFLQASSLPFVPRPYIPGSHIPTDFLSLIFTLHYT